MCVCHWFSLGDGQAQSPLPHGRNSEPQVTESNLQLVVVQPNHGTLIHLSACIYFLKISRDD